jgi:hypothetical protein
VGFRALLAFSKKLTLDPGGTRHADLTALRAVGVSGPAIQQGILIIAGFNFINRVANAFRFETPTANQCALTAYFLRRFGYRSLAGPQSDFGFNSCFTKPTSTLQSERVGAVTRFMEEWFTSLHPAGLASSEPEAKCVRHKVLWEACAVSEQDITGLKRLGYEEEDIFSLILDAASRAGLLRLRVGINAMSAEYPKRLRHPQPA